MNVCSTVLVPEFTIIVLNPANDIDFFSSLVKTGRGAGAIVAIRVYCT